MPISADHLIETPQLQDRRRTRTPALTRVLRKIFFGPSFAVRFEPIVLR